MAKLQPIEWHPAYTMSGLPANLRAWLLHPGSFMHRLRQQGAVNPRIQLLQQSWQLPEPDERQLLGLAFRTYAFVREVLIISAKEKWMYGRSVFPRRTLTGKQQQLARLKNRSLGSVIFKDRTLVRSDFEIAVLHAGINWTNRILTAANIVTEGLWARRSKLTLQQHKTFLLTEVFLPDIDLLCK